MERFEGVLKAAVGKAFPTTSLRIIYKTRTLASGIAKDSVPKHNASRVIYKFQCDCKAVYIGRTKRRFHIRRDEHVPQRLRQLIADGACFAAETTAKTVIGQHLIEKPECARRYNDDMFCFIARARNDLQLQILEALFIQAERPNLCKKKEYLYRSKLFKLLL